MDINIVGTEAAADNDGVVAALDPRRSIGAAPLPEAEPIVTDRELAPCAARR